MKKLLCFLLCLTLIFSSISFCFASPTSWDTSDQANLRYIYQTLTSGGNLYSLVNNIYTRLNTISNTITDIKGYLFDDGHSIAYWTSAISTWMSPIYNAITNVPVDLSTIIGSLGYTDTNNTYHPFLNEIDTYLSYKGMRPGWVSSPNRTFYYYNSNGSLTAQQFDLSLQGIPGSLLLGLLYGNENDSRFYNSLMGSWQNPYTYRDWTDLSGQTITPTSGIRGLTSLLEKIQEPTARLAYVLASDERIAAQEAAAANEDAVVDNFIDSSGDGSTSPSDIGSVSDLSSGYKQNFGSDASVSGIFNIFDSNNMGWFSQETKNQLDTTTPTRLTKGLESETPLLDKQIDEIYDALGVKKP